MIRGGRPDRSAKIGLMRGSAASLAGRVVVDPFLEEFPGEQRGLPRAGFPWTVPARVRSVIGDMTKAAAGNPATRDRER